MATIKKQEPAKNDLPGGFYVELWAGITISIQINQHNFLTGVVFRAGVPGVVNLLCRTHKEIGIKN